MTNRQQVNDRQFVIPVLDLLNGIVVRGVAGRRDEYRPIVSRLTDRSDAFGVACAFREQFGLTTLYVADLDAILHRRPNHDVYRALLSGGFHLLVDAGVRGAEDVASLVDAGISSVIIGLETWPDSLALNDVCERQGARIIFSLDLHGGQPLGDLSRWGTNDPFEIAVRAIAAGVSRLIVLDLEQVGVGAGVNTGELCRQLRERFPHIRLITGGGVRSAIDLAELRSVGIEGVLVASALHDGRLSQTDVECF